MQKMTTSKFKTVFAFVIAALFSFSVSAQDYTFKVTSVKGDAKANGSALKVGSKIKSGAVITVGDGTLLNVAHSNGKTLNISKKGTYKVDDLAKGCNAKKGSLSEKYAAYVLNELTSGKSDGVGADNMSKTGSVKRGDLDVKANFAVENDNAVLRFFPEHMKGFEGEAKSYTFVITDLMSTELLKAEVKEPSLTIDLSEEKYKNAISGALQYHVYINGDESQVSPEYLLKMVGGEEAIKIKEDVASLSGDNSAMNKLILAKYFEDQGLHANAMYAYEEAIKMSESNEMYENLYQAFLDRNYLSKKTKQMGSKKEVKKENKK